MKSFMKFGLAALAVTCVAGVALQAQAQLKPDESLKMRQGLFLAVKSNFGPLAAVAKGEAPLDAAAAARAANVAALTKIIPGAFGPGTENLPGSKTKAEAFTDAKFKEIAASFGAEATKLAELAAAKDEAGFKAQVAAVGKVCKACHDGYKAD